MTSMMKQYFECQQELEKKYGDKSIVLMMVGSFYEAYGVDKIVNDEHIITIENISKVLGIKLTKRNGDKPISKANTYMCGMPAYSMPKHLSKLLQNQYTVAVYDQFDSADPRIEKERRLTNIYSPSTYIDEEISANNILFCCLIESFVCPITKMQRFSAYCGHVDLSTGDNSVFEYYDDADHPTQVRQEIFKLLYCTDPSEIIFINPVKETDQEFVQEIISQYNDKMIHVISRDSKFMDRTYQEGIINKVFCPEVPLTRMKSTMEKLSMNHSCEALYCYTQLLQFTYEHNPHIIEKIQFPQLNTSSEILYMNQDAMCNLNLLNHHQLNNQTGNSFNSCFDVINKTKTKMGERLLKSRLSRPITDTIELNKRYDMVELVRPYYKEYAKNMKGIIDLDKRYRRLVIEKIGINEFSNLYSSLCDINILLAKHNNLFSIDESLIKIFKKAIQYADDKFDHTIMEKIDEFNFSNNTKSFFKPGIDLNIDKIFNRITSIDNIITNLSESLNYFTGSNNIRAQVNINFDKSGKCNIVTTKRAWENLQKLSWSHKINYDGSSKPLVFRLSDLTEETTTNNNIKLNSKLLDKFANILSRSRIIIVEECKKLFLKLMREFVSKFGETIKTISHIVAMIDVAVSTAACSVEYCYVKPILQSVENKSSKNRSSFNIKGIRHPIIERIQTETEYITNDIMLSDKNIGTLLYGLNSSGKSSLLRAIGINIVLAQSGQYCSCDCIELAPYNELFTKISASDNLFKGQSTFIVEMYCLRDILHQSGKNSLVLCDELTAGTEIQSATGIVASAIQSLTKQQTNFIFTTHLHGLMDFEEISKNLKISIFHFSIKCSSDQTKTTQKIEFSRILESGSGESQYGVEIADALGLPKQFIKNAYGYRQRNQGLSTDLLSNKRSKYNSKVIVDCCTMCGFKPTTGQHLHVHHINEQHDADENGIISGKTFHKNIRHNLMVLCEKCHHDIHDNHHIDIPE